VILPPATLGMLGGGQLGRFFVMAAHEMGYQVVVLDPDTNSPAGKIADRHLCAAYDDQDALNVLAETCAAVTTEFENVPADTLAYLAKFVPVRPGAEAVAICQNRMKEKGFLKANGLPHGPYAEIHKEEDLKTCDGALFPAILKVARFGYDGKGQARVVNEVSVVLARSASGEIKYFPVAENQHTRGILDVSIVPARASGCMMGDAQEVAATVAAKMNYIGTLGVEFFVTRGQLVVNEMAPRPHNSGHYTLDACVTDQYEQQVRALCDLPLGDASAHSAAVMVNILGDIWFLDDSHHAKEPDWAKLYAVPNLKLHLYGKHHARPGRKMGHFTVIGNDAAEVQATALAARSAIGIRD